ncbi:MAG: hypothetical protein NVV83_24330 [Afipia sp.]|nr:hypothetical protein [Afipia sp.]
MHDDGRFPEELVAAAMIGVEMRADHHIDIVRAEADGLEAGQDVFAGRHDRCHVLRKAAPAPFRIFRNGGMAAGVEQHITLRMPHQHARHRKLDHLAAVGIREIDALLHAKTAARQNMHFHDDTYLPRNIGERFSANARRPSS